jgi:hypothetical protein
MFDWLSQQELENEYWARYDYINELKAEHHDPVAEYEHLIHDDMTEEEIFHVSRDFIEK